MDAPLDRLEYAQRTIIDVAIRFGPRVLVALLILGAGIFVARWTSRWTLRALGRADLEPPVRELLARVASVCVLLLFLIVALQNLGVQLLPLIAGLSVAGAAVALAMQGVLGNAAAGLAIIFSKPFRVGEYISVVEEEGRVESISLFSTTLSHVDASLVVIPNRKIAGEVLHNFGRIRQLEIGLVVAADADLDTALAVVETTTQQNPRVLAEPHVAPSISLLPDARVRICARPRTAVSDHSFALSELSLALVAALRERGIELAPPSQRVVQ